MFPLSIVTQNKLLGSVTDAVPDVDWVELESTCEISVMRALAASGEAKAGLEFGREVCMICCGDVTCWFS